jgi:hypothetical protein
MKGLKIIMTISLILNSKGKDKFWFGDVSAGLANDKGYIFKKCFIIPKPVSTHVNFKYWVSLTSD